MNKFAKNIGVYILIFALILGFAYFLNFDGKDEVKNIPLSKMIEYLEAETNGTDKINEINIVGTEITARFLQPLTPRPKSATLWRITWDLFPRKARLNTAVSLKKNHLWHSCSRHLL